MEVLGTIGLALLYQIGGWLLVAAVAYPFFVLWDRIKDRRRPPRGPSQFRLIRGRMQRAARLTLLLTPTKTPGFSKLGGVPEMPEGSIWPTRDRGPLAFLAQLDLAEVRAAGGPDWLPDGGALWFFNDDERFGLGDHVRVMFSAEGERITLEPPLELHRKHRFAERRAGFLPLTSPPSVEWLGYDWGEVSLTDEEGEALQEMENAAFGDELQHRIGGYPSEIQSTQMSLECEHLARGLPYPPKEEPSDAIKRAARSWRLLLQVDSDEALGMNWGDGGRLYVFVREQHARAGRFDKAVSIAQTY